MVKIAQFEFLDFGPLFEAIWTWDEEEPHNENMDNAGYGSKYLIPNMSSMYVYLMMELGFAVLLTLVVLIQRKRAMCSRVMVKLQFVIYY